MAGEPVQLHEYELAIAFSGASILAFPSCPKGTMSAIYEEPAAKAKPDPDTREEERRGKGKS